MQHQIDRGRPGENARSHDLAKPALQPIAVDRGAPVLRDNESGTRVASARKGSDYPNIEVFGAESLPCSRDHAQLGAARDAMTTRKSGGRTRRR